jgi:hypothetical protein
MSTRTKLQEILEQVVLSLNECANELSESAAAIVDEPAPYPDEERRPVTARHCVDRPHCHELLDTPEMLAAIKKTAWLEAWAPPCEGQPALRAWVCWKGHHSCNVQICYKETYYPDGHNAHAHKRWVSTNCVPMRNDWTLTFAQHGDCHHE